MLVNAVFHVYESEQKGNNQQIDGRLLSDIRIQDRLILLKGADISYYNEYHNFNGYLEIDKDANLELVHLVSIWSYGKYWDILYSGMSARIVCSCEGIIKGNDVIYEIVNEISCSE